MYHKILADGFFVFAAIAILASMYGWSVNDIFLASTQWLLVAIVMLLMAIYIRLSRDDDEKMLAQRRSKNPVVSKAAAKKRASKKHLSFRLSA